MFKVDLHTHSVASPDGGLTEAHYKRMLASGRLHYIAITDHNTVDFALRLQAVLGERIIVGEEIMTNQGEVIGLYLHRTIPAGLELTDAIAAIRSQNGIAYVPHPFETVRKGLQVKTLQAIADSIDIIEVRNGRAQGESYSRQANLWADTHDLPGAASSDAHGWYGWGNTYSILATAPTRQTLAHQLRRAELIAGSPGLIGRLYPSLNRLRKGFGHA